MFWGEGLVWLLSLYVTFFSSSMLLCILILFITKQRSTIWIYGDMLTVLFISFSFVFFLVWGLLWIKLLWTFLCVSWHILISLGYTYKWNCSVHRINVCSELIQYKCFLKLLNQFIHAPVPKSHQHLLLLAFLILVLYTGLSLRFTIWFSVISSSIEHHYLRFM